MAEPTAAAAANADDWPRPGDVGYYVGDFDDTDDGRSLADLRRDLIVFFVGDATDGGLFYVGAKAEMGNTSGMGHQSLIGYCYEPGDDAIKRTLAEGLRASARKEREYGRKCLELADTLERLAAEAEGGNGDG